MFTKLLSDVYLRNLGMLSMALEDFSDADMLVRPCPAANHTAWQLGHLFASESQLVNAVSPGKGGVLPEGFAAKFSKEMAQSNDKAAFPTKSELLAAATTVRTASAEWVRGLSEADFAKAGPANMLAFIPTVGNLAVLIPEHLAMHLGQIQVVRRVLGKPVLF